MSARLRIVANRYQDSVALMAVSSKLLAVDGVTAASVVMATPENLDNLARAGLGDGGGAGPSDLVVAVAGTDDACAAALALADELLAERTGSAPPGTAAVEAPTSIHTAVARDPALNLALVSVPGPFAAAEATKALRLGLHVMVFSDNVPVHEELALKQLADELDLLVMGPDCGTAIIAGLPLGFANVVRRGPVGVVGASGTGMQEITARIHQLGSGVSHALGTGGHDLAEAIGGRSVRRGLRWLDEDPSTEVIVLVSKPPAPAVAAAVLAQARAQRTPTVVIFLGADPAAVTGGSVHGAATLADAADLAVALASGGPVPAAPGAAPLPPGLTSRVEAAAARTAPSQRHLRGVFCGGTFCFEAQLLCRAAGVEASSNTPVADNRPLDDPTVSTGHTIVDMGDDVFTRGRPHPMIDPAGRDERVAREAADPSTAVLLLDVVLGYGSADDPVAGLVPVLAGAESAAERDGRALTVIAHVCGTDLDPQGRDGVVARLEEAGVLVAASNAEAARLAAHLVTRLPHR